MRFVYPRRRRAQTELGGLPVGAGTPKGRIESADTVMGPADEGA
jgi:hypothetical protein